MVLAPTYGAMIYQEQVMAVTRLLAGYDESEADGVRRILGKKKVSAIAEAGQTFLDRVDMPREQAERLWAQMAEFSKYGFNKSHAYAYAFLAFWTAFLKVNYPREFLVAAMSTVDKDRVPEFVKEARRLDVEVLPPDINTSGPGFTADPKQYAVRYGLGSVKGVGDVAVRALVETQPYASWEDFETRRSPKANAGVVALLARIGAFDTLVANRRGLEAKLLAAKTGDNARCVHKDESLAQDNLEAKLLPCSFDWSSEPAPVNKRTGKKLKPKPIPKRCTKACRQYTAPPPLQIETVEPYSPVDIRTIEHEMLGTYLSSTPFDDLDPNDRAVCRAQAEQVATGPNGTYYVAAIVAGARPHKTGEMGFLTLETELSTLRVAVFRDAWAVEQRRFVKGALCLAELRKNDRGLSLVTYQPL
jgi:DNA polymerase-3 subunit alpha